MTDGSWDFTTGGTDSAGDNDLTLIGGATIGSGLFGGGLQVDGQTGSGAVATSDYDLGGGDFTIQVWVKYDSLDGEQTLIEEWTGGSGPGWTLTSWAGMIRFEAPMSSGTLQLNASYSGFALGTWNQFVVTRNGDVFSAYCNGELRTQQTRSGEISQSSNPLLIGARNADDGRNFTTEGTIDNVVIRDHAWSPTEVQLAWNGGAGQEAVPSLGTLYTYGATVTDTVEGFEAFDSIRHSTDSPEAPVSLVVSGGGTLDLVDELADVSAFIQASETGNEISTGTGNDTLIADGRHSYNRFDGGEGHDTLTATGNLTAENTFFGGEGNDVLTGGGGFDGRGTWINELYGGTGHDTLSAEAISSFGSLYGGDGDDSVQGGVDTGLSLLYGGDGNDTVIGGAKVTNVYNEAYLYGGVGHDSLIAGQDSAANWLYGGVGSDTLVGSNGAGYNSLYGDDGDDQLYAGTSSFNYLAGGSGSDTLHGSSGSDDLFGGAGADLVYAGHGHDSVYGGDDWDTVVLEDLSTGDFAEGGAGGDWINGDQIELHGGEGVETIQVFGSGAVSVDGYVIATGFERYIFSGGAGNDSISFEATSGTAYGDGGHDALIGTTGIETFYGGQGDDVLHLGGAVSDNWALSIFEKAFGGGGNDTLTAGNVYNTLDGGTGNDTLNGGNGQDHLFGGDAADNAYGGSGDDTIQGGAGADFIYGGDNNDYITGGEGDDYVEGGAGADFIDTSPGSYFDDRDAGNDTIFAGSGNDNIWASLSASATVEIDSGADNDIIALFGSTPTSGTINGGSGTDYLQARWGDISTLTISDVETLGTYQNYGAPRTIATAAQFESFDTIINYPGQETSSVSLELAATGSVDLTDELLGRSVDFLGTSGADEITTSNGNDVLRGNGGDDLLDGGSGFDIATFSGNRSVYSVVLNADGSISVTDRRDGGADGTDHLESIERLEFADSTVELDTSLILSSILDFSEAPSQYTWYDPDYDTYRIQDHYLENGFRISTPDVVEPGPAFAEAGDAVPHGTGHYLVHNYPGTTVALVQNDGGVFGVTSIDLGRWGASTEVTFVGTRADGSIETFTTSVTSSDWQTVELPSWFHSELSELRWTPEANRWLRFDNVSITTVDLNLSNTTIEENAAGSSLVGVLSSADPDEGDIYELRDSAVGRFQLEGNELVVADGAVLDFEGRDSYAVTIRITNASGLYQDRTFTITVTDVNEEPGAPVLSGGTIAESAEAGDVVGTVSASDPDDGAALTYALADDAEGRFVIDQITGVITVAEDAEFDFETSDGHTITVEVSDGEYTRTEVFTIAVQNRNEAPDTLALWGGEIEEGATSGTEFVWSEATDPDADSLSFSLVDDFDGLFVIDAATGVVTLGQEGVLDHEADLSYELTVLVSDGTLGRQETLLISVLNVDEAPTDIQLGGDDPEAETVTLEEGLGSGSLVASFSAVDPEGGAFSYALAEGSSELFSIDEATGELTVAEDVTLDFDTQGGTHTIVVEATDESGLSYEKSFTITVTDVNEKPTDIIVSGGTVRENSTGGTLVATLDAVDPDAGETFRFAIDPPSDLFEIVGNTIRVVAGAQIDYEELTSHTITLVVTDSVGNEHPEEFTIQVENVSGFFVGTSATDRPAGTSEEDVYWGRGGSDTLSGEAGNDTLYGEAGNDRLLGGAGSDTLVGGLNDDSYVLTGDDPTQDTLEEQANQGIDTVEVDADYTLGNHLERLVLTGSADLSGTGNALANTLTGNSGANILDGGLGADSMIGGLGDDTYIIDNAGDVASETSSTGGVDEVQTTLATQSLAAWSYVENLTYLGSGAFTGTGNGLANTITGGAGQDTLDGGTNSDRMIGGVGNDTYAVAQAGDQVVEAAGEGTDTVRSSVTYVLSADVENLVLAAGTTSIHATGNELANTLTGNGGANTLDGGLGADALIGGLGNDIYIVDDASDAITEAASAGTDTVRTTLASFSLDTLAHANIDHLAYTGSSSFSGTGNALINTLTGSTGADQLFGGGNSDVLNGGEGSDWLDGGAGVDTMTGGSGEDTYVVDNASDRISSGELAGNESDTVLASVTYSISSVSNVENLTLLGAAVTGTGNGLANTITGSGLANTLQGGAGNDVLLGAAGIDSLNGGTGNDTLAGGAGDDVLTSGATTDFDVFVFATSFGAERVTDFDHTGLSSGAAQDRIDISALGITAATFGTRVTFTDLGSDILVTIDGDATEADGDPAQTIRLVNAQLTTNITTQDFILA